MKSLLYTLLCFCLFSCSKKEANPVSTSPAVSLHSQKEMSSYLPQGIVADITKKPYVYIAAKNGGLIVLETSTKELTQVAQIPIANLNNMEVMHLYQQGNYLYLALGNFFEKGHKAGLAIINSANPKSPIIESVWEAKNTAKGSAFVKVVDDHAYLCTMNAGVFILDISNKKNILELSQIIPDKNYPTQNPNSVQEPNARGLDIQGNYLYVAYDAGGIRTIDISSKENPVEVSNYINTNFNKQKAYNNILIDGSYAYVATDYCGMETLDISDPENIKRVSWCNPWLCESPSNNWFNSPGHANQLALDHENKLIYLSSGASEITVIDVSNPLDCTFKYSIGSRATPEAVWGLTFADKKLYATYINSIIPFQGNWSGVKCYTTK